MSIKRKIGWLVIILLTLILIGYFLRSYRSKKSLITFNNWFNGWVKEEIDMRKTYHLKLDSLSVVEINNQDYHNVEKLKKYKHFLEQLGKVELWKIDKSFEIDKIYYDQIDKLFGGETDLKEQISFLKLKFNEGFKEVNNFRQITVNYVNDQLKFLNYLIERNCNLNKNDEKMYTLLSSNVENSSKTYNNSVSDMFNNKLRRVKEFNEHFKNENVGKLIQIVEKGE
jgi:hypothetical protein